MARTASGRPTSPTTDSTTARGRRAEQLAQHHLESLGLVITARNVRVGRDELDLVGWDGAVLVVVEVRSARAGAMVDPAESLTRAKRARLRGATARYAQSVGAREARIDFVAVVDDRVEHIPNAIDFTET